MNNSSLDKKGKKPQKLKRITVWHVALYWAAAIASVAALVWYLNL